MNTGRRTLRYETLEKRALLSANPIAGLADGLLLSSKDDLVLVSNSLTKKIDEFWPAPDLEATWIPLATGDFTGDGVSDIYGKLDNGRVGLQVNDGQQLFYKYWGESISKSMRIVGQGDINDDGLVDIVSFDDSSNELWVSINNLELGFSNHQWGTWGNGKWGPIFVGDFDRDGFTDVLGGERNGSWWLAKSDGSRFENRVWGAYPDYDWQNVVSGDFNGDQFIDVAARAQDNTWWVWNGSETGLSPAMYRGHWKMRSSWHNVQAADFNADGKDDLIGRSEDGDLWVGTSSETSFHTWSWATGWIDAANWQTFEIADIGGDGLPELIGEAADGTWWYAENLDGRFRNHYLGRDFQFVGTARGSQPVAVSDVSGLFAVGDLETPSGDGTAERNRDIYESYVSTSTGNSDAPHDVEQVEFSINEAGKLVIHKTKERALAIKIDSASRSIVTATSPAPFSDFLVNDARSVLLIHYGSDPVSFVTDITLDLGWTESGDLPVVQYLNVSDGEWHPITHSGESNSVVPPAELDPVDTTSFVTEPLIVSRNEEGQIIVTGIGQLIAGGLDFKSPSGGLIPGASPTPFHFFLNNSPTNVAMVLWPKNSVRVDGKLILDLRWDGEIDFQELVVEYGLGDVEETFSAAVED